MLVSKSFYKIAGPLLYQEIIYPKVKLDGLLKGEEMGNRGTRSRPATVNLKNDLLDQVRVFEIGWHVGVFFGGWYEEDTWHDCWRPIKLSKLRTLRFVFAMWCDCEGYRHCELCRSEYDYLARRCPLLNELRAPKIVLTSLRLHNLRAVFDRLGEIIQQASVLSVVLAPYTFSLHSELAERLSNLLEASSALSSPLKLRLLVAPWTEYVRSSALKASSSEGLRVVSRAAITYLPIGPEGYIDFFASIASTTYDTTVYLLNDARTYFEPDLCSSSLYQKFDIEQIQSGVFEAFGDDTTKWPNIELKTRADYLREGVTDEIDEVELNRWREEERLERAGDPVVFGRMIVGERKEWEQRLEREGRKLLSGSPLEAWTEDGTVKDQERNEEDDEWLLALVEEMESFDSRIVEEGIATLEAQEADEADEADGVVYESLG